MEILFTVFVGIVGMCLGIKIGVERLADNLRIQHRLHPNEYNYITSIQYFIDCFKLK